jgi:hypothetical protein
MIFVVAVCKTNLLLLVEMPTSFQTLIKTFFVKLIAQLINVRACVHRLMIIYCLTVNLNNFSGEVSLHNLNLILKKYKQEYLCNKT